MSFTSNMVLQNMRQILHGGVFLVMNSLLDTKV